MVGLSFSACLFWVDEPEAGAVEVLEVGRIVARHPLPHGSGAIHLSGQVFAVLGKPKGIRFAGKGQEHEPSEPVVIARLDVMPMTRLIFLASQVIRRSLVTKPSSPPSGCLQGVGAGEGRDADDLMVVVTADRLVSGGLC